MRFFNTAGPCKSDIHYMLPPISRLPGVRRIIEQQGYFVIHTPHQTGKTTAMLAGRIPGHVPPDDRQYLVDLGLVRRDPSGGLVIANPIYRQVIPRALASGPQDSLPHIRPT
jgi:hypothetical protein